MTHSDQQKKNIDHLVWAIQHHAQIHKGKTGEAWLWPSKRMLFADEATQQPVDSRIDQLEKEPQIRSSIQLLMSSNRNDLFLKKNNSNVLQNESQMMLETTMDVILQAATQFDELSKANKRVGSAGRVVEAFKACFPGMLPTADNDAKLNQLPMKQQLV